MRAVRKILLLYVFIGLGNLIPISAQTSKIDSLKKIIETGVRDTSMVTVLNTLSTETKDFKKSFEYAEQANDLATSLNYKLGKAYALKNMGIVEYYQGNYVAVLDYWLQSLEIFESLQNDLGIANLTNNLGAIYYSQGSSVKAIDYYLRSLSIAEKLNDPFRITSALSNIGAVYGQMGAYDQALHFRVAIGRFGLEIAAKGGFGIEAEDRRIEVAAVLHQNRFVIGDELGKQRQAEQDREHDQ